MSDSFLQYWFHGFDRSLAELDEKAIGTLTARCGQACSDSYARQIYMDAYAASETLDAFIAQLNRKFAGMRMRRVDAETIEFVYTRCACDLVENGYVSDPRLCLCSLYSLKYNWEAVLGKGSVECVMEQSILGGGNCCRFIVKLVL